jgi:hypothetical protein
VESGCILGVDKSDNQYAVVDFWISTARGRILVISGHPVHTGDGEKKS